MHAGGETDRSCLANHQTQDQTVLPAVQCSIQVAPSHDVQGVKILIEQYSPRERWNEHGK